VKRPYAAICVPSGTDWKPAMGAALAHLAMASLPTLDLTVLQVPGSTAGCRNQLVLAAHELKADWILWIDNDMEFPADGLTRLVAHGKDIVGAFYSRKTPPFTTVGHLVGALPDFARPGPVGIRQADRIGCGFLLTRMSVFERVPAPWFFESFDWSTRSPENVIGRVTEDTNFLIKAFALGLQAWVDFDLTFQMGHIGEHTVGCNRPPAEPAKMEAAA